MSRFDPHPDNPYAKCLDCQEVLPTEEAMREHLEATMTNGRSHRARINNPSRAERIRNEIATLATDAAEEFAGRLWRLVDYDGVTEEELDEAVRLVDIDVAEAWEDSK